MGRPFCKVSGNIPPVVTICSGDVSGPQATKPPGIPRLPTHPAARLLPPSSHTSSHWQSGIPTIKERGSWGMCFLIQESGSDVKFSTDNLTWHMHKISNKISMNMSLGCSHKFPFSYFPPSLPPPTPLLLLHLHLLFHILIPRK